MPVDPNTRRRGVCVIVHGNPLVAEDLREILASEGAGDIMVAAKASLLAHETPILALVEGQVDDIAGWPQVAEWRAHGAEIVAMPGFTNRETSREGFHILEQPFRGEQVADLIRKLQLF